MKAFVIKMVAFEIPASFFYTRENTLSHMIFIISDENEK